MSNSIGSTFISYSRTIPVRYEPRRSRLSWFVGVTLCILVGIMLGLVLAFYVMVSWVRLDTPPLYETSEVESGFLQ